MLRFLFVTLPCRWLSWLCGPGDLSTARSTRPAIVTAVAGPALVGCALGATLGLVLGSARQGAGAGVVVGVAVGLTFIAYAYVLATAMGLTGRDWQNR